MMSEQSFEDRGQGALRAQASPSEVDVYTAHGFWERTRHYDPAEVQMAIDLCEAP